MNAFSAPTSFKDRISSIAIEEGQLYAACNFSFMKVGMLRESEAKWRYTLPTRMNVSRIVAAGKHIIGFDRENDLLTIWLADSGEVLCDAEVDEYIGACTISDNKIFFGTQNGNLSVLIPENFSLEAEPVLQRERQENPKNQTKPWAFFKMV